MKCNEKAQVKIQPHLVSHWMWTIEEEQVKKEKALCMTSHEKSQRKDILSLKERKIVGTMENLVTWRNIVGLKKYQGDGSYDENKEANVASNYLQDALILCLDNANDEWVIDFGASFHATPHRKYF